MNIKPVESPHQVAQTQPNPNQRSKAIEAFKAGRSSYDAPAQAQETPVANPNKISPEELSAIRPNTNDISELAPHIDPAPEAKPEPKDPALTRQFEQLARQERQQRARVQQERKALELEKAEVAKQRTEIADLQKKYSDGYISRDELRQNTLRVLADNQVSYDDLTQQILNQPSINPQVESTINALKAEIKALRDGVEEDKAQQVESQQQAYKAAIKQIEMDVRATVRNDPNFETIRATRSEGDVTQLIEETYKQDGRLMTVEEACEEVENYLIDEAMKVTRIGKIKQRLQQAGQPKATQQTQAKPADTPSMKTLTNATASTRKLTSKERAILAFKNQLK